MRKAQSAGRFMFMVPNTGKGARAGRSARRMFVRTAAFMASVVLVSGIGIAAAGTAQAATQSDTDVSQYVNPFVSTADDDGQDLPGAQSPHGIVKVNPMTSQNRTHSGYNYSDTKISGFTHTNLDGVGGSGGGGDILVVPTSVNYSKRPDTSSYAHTFSHSDESAKPGYYQVGLSQTTGQDSSISTGTGSIEAKMTASVRTGLDRFTFPSGQAQSLVFDMKNNFTERISSSLSVSDLSDGRKAISGSFAGQFNGAKYTMYYYATTSSAVKTLSTWGDAGTLSSALNQSGTDTGAVLTFDPSAGQTIGLDVTVSPISAEQAKIDQSAEIASKSFADIQQQAYDSWNDVLGRVQVTASAENDPDGSMKKLFYTHLYRLMALPTNATSTSGTYRGVDGVVHSTDGAVHYDGWATWDDWHKFGVIAMLYPDMYKDMAQSLVDTFADSQAASTTASMSSLMQSVPNVRWERSAEIIADALNKGFSLKRVSKAYPALQRLVGSYSSENDARGYIPDNPGSSVQLGYDDWALSIIATSIGNSTDAATYEKQAAYPFATQYKPSAWTAKDGTAVSVLSSRDSSGNWGNDSLESFQAANLYQGTLWQYNWYDTYDMEAMIKAMGGTTATRLALQHMFGEDGADDGTGMLHSNANEVELQTPYLFNYVGMPSQTQKWVRQIYAGESWNRYIATGSTDEYSSSNGEFTPPIKTKVYKLDPKGFLPTMDNDAGTMSSMYVAAAVGLFPVTMGSSQYQVGSPFFDSVSVSYPSGRNFTVNASGASSTNYYIASASLNGKSYANTWVDYSDMTSGGTLDFGMQSTASDWGEHSAAAYSMSNAASHGGTTESQWSAILDRASVDADGEGKVRGTYTFTFKGATLKQGAAGSDPIAEGAIRMNDLPSTLTATARVTGASTLEVSIEGTATQSAHPYLSLGDALFEKVDGVSVDASKVSGKGLSEQLPLTVSVTKLKAAKLSSLVDGVQILQQKHYSSASYQRLSTALASAKQALSASTLNDDDISAAQDDLSAATAALAIVAGPYRTLQAEQSDSWSGGDLKNESYQSAGDLGGVSEGSWVSYQDMDFSSSSDPQNLTIRYATSYGASDEASTVEVHAGDASGTVIATVDLSGTSGFGNYTTSTVSLDASAVKALKAASGVTFVFHKPSSRQWVGNFDWFRFGSDELSYPTLQASNLSAKGDGAKAINTSNGMFENLTTGAWVEWDSQDFGSGVDKVSVLYDKPTSRAASDSHIELHLASKDGPVVASIPLAYTGSSWGSYATATASVDPTVFKGVQTVFASFVSTTETSSLPYVANVKTISFSATASSLVVKAASRNADSGGSLGDEQSSWNDGTGVRNLKGTSNGDWLRYDDIDFSDVARTDISVHYVNNSSRDGLNSRIAVYLDPSSSSDLGTPYTTIALPFTGSNWSSAGNTTVHLPTAITGKHTVYLQLLTEAYDGHPYVSNIDSLTFLSGVDTTELAAAYKKYADINNDARQYNSIYYSTFAAQMQSSYAMLESQPDSQSDVDEQTRSLALAADQLVSDARLQLEYQLANAAALDESAYTVESWSAVRDAISAGKQVDEDASSTDEQMNSAAKALNTAIEALVTTPKATAPSSPANVTMSAEGQDVTVSWSAPESDGGSSITAYTVVLSDGSTAQSDKLSYTFTAKQRGTSYSATVAASNGVGNSEAAKSVNSVTVGAVVPETPGMPKVSVDKTVLHISWDAPDNGGSPIISYQVLVDGKARGVFTDTSATIDLGATGAGKHTVAVIASNQIGDSKASAATSVLVSKSDGSASGTVDLPKPPAATGNNAGSTHGAASATGGDQGASAAGASVGTGGAVESHRMTAGVAALSLLVMLLALGGAKVTISRFLKRRL
ncbi:glycoside hydrolase domain-containing protein [Bifidobacterium psychraerophilum]|nr:glycoside hydrolase domain-containing protein [Bifidobacterium psychraerophilum]